MLATASPFSPIDYATSLGLPEAGCRDLVFIASNEPGRVARSSPFNSAGRYPSRKNGGIIQFESRTLERVYVVVIEFDPDVIAYFDQPPVKITFVHEDPDGTKFPVTLQPDFAVCRRSGVEIVDVMRAAELEEKAARHPGFYVKDAAGSWHCPAAEAWAAERGFLYSIVTESDLDPVLVRNCLSLADAAGEPEPPADVLEPVLERVAAEPGVTLGALAREGMDMALVKSAIAHGRLHFDRQRHVIDDPDHAPVYPSREVALLLDERTPASWAIGGEPPESLAIEPGTRLRWGESEAEIAAVANQRVWLAMPAGRTVELDRDDVEAFWRSGSIRPLPDDRADLEAISRDVALERYRRGGRGGLEVGLRRLEIIGAYGRARTDPSDPHWTTGPGGRRLFGGVAPATIEDWIRERRRVKAATGDPLAGLVPAANPGNRTARLGPQVEAILLDVARELYASPDRRTIRSIVGEVRRRVKAAGLSAPHPRTVRARLKRLPVYETARARLGDSAAYGLEPFSPIDPDAPPPNGAYPNQVLHIDHTVADQETIDRETNEPLGRLYLSRAFDGRTGRECAHLWSYEQPSAATITRLLIRYAERFGRLPESIVLDKDPAHRSLELLAFCEAFSITIIWRRTRRGRDGWRVERPFGTLNQDLFYALSGNTQASRNPRQLTKDNDPRLRTVWDLVEIDRRYARSATPATSASTRCSGPRPRRPGRRGSRWRASDDSCGSTTASGSSPCRTPTA